MKKTKYSEEEFSRIVDDAALFYNANLIKL